MTILGAASAAALAIVATFAASRDIVGWAMPAMIIAFTSGVLATGMAWLLAVTHSLWSGSNIPTGSLKLGLAAHLVSIATFVVGPAVGQVWLSAM